MFRNVTTATTRFDYRTLFCTLPRRIPASPFPPFPPFPLHLNSESPPYKVNPIDSKRRSKAIYESMGSRYSRQYTENEEEVGTRIVVRRLDPAGPPSEGGNELTPAIVSQLKNVCEKFEESCPSKRVIKIEYLMNDQLYEGFNATKRRFKRQGRHHSEKVLFHGTHPDNIEPFDTRTCYSDLRIILDGLRRGGINGHRVANGSRMVRHPVI